MAELRRETLADRIATTLLARIRGGEWAVGAKLPGETTLAAELGVGRSTVREAIRLLATRGVLQPRHGAGVFVVALDVPDDWDAVLRRASIVSVLEVRIAIESEAAELAAVRRTNADLKAMNVALEHLAVAHGDLSLSVPAELEFHRAAVAAAHNDVMLQLYEGFVPLLAQSVLDMDQVRGPRERDPGRDLHVRLVERIEARDSAGASRAIRTHLEELVASLR